MRRLLPVLGLAALSLVPVPAQAGLQGASFGPLTEATADVMLDGASAAMAFVENRGQWPDEVRFRAAVGGAVVWVTDDSVVYDFSVAVNGTGPTATVGPGEGNETQRASDPTADREVQPAARRGHVVAMRFDGAQAAHAVGDGALPGYYNYFRGSDASGWVSRVPRYAEVVLEDLFAGVDLRLYSDGGLPRYDLVLAPGADLSQVRMRIDGADDVTVGADGTVSMQTSLGPVEQRGLVAYQQAADGSRQVVPSAFQLGSDGSLGFTAAAVDPDKSLVIDPLIWSTFLGGSDGEFLHAMAVAQDGSVFVGGYTYGQDYPTTPGAYDPTSNGLTDAVVSALSADGSELLYSTYLGGEGDDDAWDLALGADGSLTVVGGSSFGFPVTPGAYDTDRGDTFVTRLSADGTSLVYSTFVGGKFIDSTRHVALRADGSAVVAGSTQSSDFPTTAGAYDTTYSGHQTGFVAQLSPDATRLTYGTFVDWTPTVGAVGIGADEAITIAGVGEGVGLPTTPDAYDPTSNGDDDVLLARFSEDGASVDYATFFGGTGRDYLRALAFGPDGSLTIAGYTDSVDLPTTPEAFDPSYNSDDDGFIARLAADGRSLGFSTYLGGAGDEDLRALAVSRDGSVVVTGEVSAAFGAQPFPTTPDAYDRTEQGFHDTFVTRLPADGSALLYSTLIGGGDVYGEAASGVALGPDGAATVAGYSSTSDYPTTRGAYQVSAAGNFDGFVTRLDVGAGCPLAVGRTSISPPTIAPGGSVTLEVDIANAGPTPRDARLDLDYQRNGARPSGTFALGSGTVPVTGGVTARVTVQVRPDAPDGTYALDLKIRDQAGGPTCDSSPATLTVRSVEGANSVDEDRLFEEDTTGTLGIGREPRQHPPGVSG